MFNLSNLSLSNLNPISSCISPPSSEEPSRSTSPLPPLLRPVSPITALSTKTLSVTTSYVTRTSSFIKSEDSASVSDVDPFSAFHSQVTLDSTVSTSSTSNYTSRPPMFLRYDAPLITGATYIDAKTGKEFIFGPMQMDERWPYTFDIGQKAYARSGNNKWRIVTIVDGPFEEFDSELSRHVFVYTGTWTTPDGITYRANFSSEWGTLKPVADAWVDEVMRGEGVQLMPLLEDAKKKEELRKSEDNDSDLQSVVSC